MAEGIAAPLSPEQKATIDSDLEKVGKTVGKLVNGMLTFFGDNLLPGIEAILVKVATGLLQSWGESVLRKNGVTL